MKEFFEKIENLYIFMALGQVGEKNYGKDWEWYFDQIFNL
jgi:hypothetical protein